MVIDLINRLLVRFGRRWCDRMHVGCSLHKGHHISATGCELCAAEWRDVHGRKQLGHSNIGTTARYLDHIAPTRVVEAVRKRKWRKKK